MGPVTFQGNRPTFHRARRPTHAELSQLLDTLSRRIVRVLERRGLLTADPEHPYLDLEPGSSLDHLQAASIAYRIIYRYKQPFRDGLTHVVLEPLDFIARLAALVPRPRLNLT